MNARILIVDDERDNRELLDIILTREGFRIVTASGSDEAFASMALDRPDLILLDVMMPGMTGYEVAAKIKGDSATKDIPIIMVSALNDRNAAVLAVSAGAECLLTKPINRTDLCMRVRSLLPPKT